MRERETKKEREKRKGEERRVLFRVHKNKSLPGKFVMRNVNT
jgi:hypothetical protein